MRIPHKIGIAFQRFNLVYIPIVVVLAVGFYLVQGVRWWTLNRALGITFPLRDTVFLTETGQATALLPLGELTRALLLSKAAAVHLGSVVASETVQELLFVFMLFALALPRALGLHLIAIAVVVPMLFVIAIVAVLTVERLYARVRRIIGRVPVLKRLRPAVDELHRDTRRALPASRHVPIPAAERRPGGHGGEPALGGRAGGRSRQAQLDERGLRLRGDAGGSVVELLAPGGLGAVEASTAGLLVLLGISFDHRHRDLGHAAARRQGSEHRHRLDLLPLRPPPLQPDRSVAVPLRDAARRGGGGSRSGLSDSHSTGWLCLIVV